MWWLKPSRYMLAHPIHQGPPISKRAQSEIPRHDAYMSTIADGWQTDKRNQHPRSLLHKQICTHVEMFCRNRPQWPPHCCCWKSTGSSEKETSSEEDLPLETSWLFKAETRSDRTREYHAGEVNTHINEIWNFFTKEIKSIQNRCVRPPRNVSTNLGSPLISNDYPGLNKKHFARQNWPTGLPTGIGTKE